ncbi:MAG TPA: FecR family protein [Steroidobacteraceae bacterium]|nr:FecR family protein [Steroidobacteraceae bacterium]
MKTQTTKLNRQILEEASDWFVDFRVGDVDERARERFDEWLRRSPEHIRAYMEIAKTYVVLPALTPNRKIAVQDLIAYARSDDNIVPFDQPTPSQPARASGVSSSADRRGPWFSGLIAASMAVLAVSTGVLSWVVLHRLPTYATDIGERRTVTLSDGSTIDLNAKSRVSIRFSKGERQVELVDGQALFRVAKDADRPFLVHTGSAVVRAVGTEFDVYRKSSGTTVTVVEGRVSVTHEGAGTAVPTLSAESTGSRAAQPEPTLVSAGEQVTVTERTIAAPKRINVAGATAWTQHQLVFDTAPLSDVVDGFNRYNTRQIVIEDLQLQDFHVSGVYSSTDPASLIRFLREQPGVRVIETDRDVRITRQ